MALNFPNAPAVGDYHPMPAVAGVAQYQYDGEKWLTVGGSNAGAVPATALPLMDGAAAVGIAVKYAREDHRHPTDVSFVAKGGDTMTGDLWLTKNSPNVVINNTAANPASYLSFYQAGLPRWMVFTANAETGANAGGDLFFGAYADVTASLIGGTYPFWFTRSTGVANFGRQIQANNGMRVPIGGAGAIDMGGGAQISNDGTFLNLIGGAGKNILIGNNGVTYFRQSSGFYFQNSAGLSCFAVGIDGSMHTYGNGAGTPGYNLYWSGGTLMGRMIANGPQEVDIQNNYCGSTLALTFNSALTFSGAYAGKPGGGAWNDSSDIRIKTVTGDYKAGLDEILKLTPRTFTYKGNDTTMPPANALAGLEVEDDKDMPAVPYANSPHAIVAKSGQEFIGLIAQEVEPVMPEMVTKEAAYIDGEPVDDLLKLDSSALVYALVNAVKTLTARIAALEAGKPA